MYNAPYCVSGGNMKYAHSENEMGKKESVIEHMREVSELASQYAATWGGDEEAKITGIFHDLGKYGDLFQEVLLRRAIHVDHATPGAVALINKYSSEGVAGAIAVHAHHDGLITGFYSEFKKLIDLSEAVSHEGKKFSSRDINQLLNMLKGDGYVFPTSMKSRYPEIFKANIPISAMLYIRMLFSALVDADFLATEAHFAHDGNQYQYREKGPPLNSELLLERLKNYVNDLCQSSQADESIVHLRNDLFDCCSKASDSPKGIYTLTAPTGAGKTLAMLAYALGHCRKHNMRRIILVLPFLNIIDQSAKTYERVFEGLYDEPLILQDHSLAESAEGDLARLLAQNWDSPIVITTTVKFFEGLFANKSTKCRRLHSIADSVIIFDEAQVMPQGLAVHTLAALSFLQQNYGCTTVFSTATQPAFSSLDEKVSAYSQNGWKPSELVPDSLDLFNRARRVEVDWPENEQSWEEICSEASAFTQLLVITNLRKHALLLHRLISRLKPGEVFHLSTNMCSAHRLDVLEEVKWRLSNKEPCSLISTQCVEAGVDLDFPNVFRAMGPLEAIAQAAGRCNREGRLDKGNFKVFMPVSDGREYPTDDYSRAAIELKMMLKEYGTIDIYDPAMIREYYQRYFTSVGEKMVELDDAVRRYDFKETADRYKWIKRIGAEILVPYSSMSEEVKELSNEAREKGINASWIRRARPYAVTMQVKEDMLRSGMLETAYMRNQRGGISKEESGWYILLHEQGYSDEIGLDLSGQEIDYIIGGR